MDKINVLQDLERVYASKPGCKYTASAGFYELVSTGESIIDSQTLVLIVQTGPLIYSINILNTQEKPYYVICINEHLNFGWDQSNNSVMWSYFDEKGNNLGFKLYFMNAYSAMYFNWHLSVAVMENRNKIFAEELISKEKNDWKEFYEPKVEQPEELNAYQQFVAPEIVPMELEYSNVKIKIKEPVMQQARILDRAFIAQENNKLAVFKTDESDDKIELILDFPSIKSKNGEELKPKKFFFQKEDTQIVMTSVHNPKKAYLIDVDKATVVNEFKFDAKESASINSICPYGKHSEFTQNPLFYGLNEKSVSIFDPRTSKGTPSDNKTYSKNMGFTTVAAGNEGQYVVGADNGEIRLYDKIGNARNLIPSLYGDPIISIDCSKDGRWLLATTKGYLILLATVIGEKSAYTKTFLKTDKPTPKILKIDPKHIQQYKIKEINLKMGKFDDKKAASEEYICAINGEFLLLWSLKNIAKGKLVSSEIRKFNQPIIHNEFKWNGNNLITMLPEEVIIQKTKIK